MSQWTQANPVDDTLSGDTTEAAIMKLDAEFKHEYPLLAQSFDGSTGHKHTGGTDDGPQIPTNGIADGAITAAKISPTYFPFPIVGSFKNLVVRVTSGATITVSADNLVVALSGSSSYQLSSVSCSLATGSNGANGLDTGSLANNTWYSVYVIYNPTTSTTASLLSLSSSSPTLPSGYTHFARTGWVRSNSSAALVPTLQLGRTAQYINGNSPVMVSGAAALNTTINISSSVPPTAIKVIGYAYLINGSSWLVVAPNGYYGAAVATGTAAPPVSIYTGTSDYQNRQFSWILDNLTIIYGCSSSNSGVNCLGWEDNI